jgi:hypothetical protein
MGKHVHYIHTHICIHIYKYQHTHRYKSILTIHIRMRMQTYVYTSIAQFYKHIQIQLLHIRLIQINKHICDYKNKKSFNIVNNWLTAVKQMC